MDSPNRTPSDRNGTGCPPVAEVVLDGPGVAYPLNAIPPAVMMRRDVVVAGGLGFALGVGVALGILYLCNQKR